MSAPQDHPFFATHEHTGPTGGKRRGKGRVRGYVRSGKSAMAALDRLLVEGGPIDRLLKEGSVLDRLLVAGGPVDRLLTEGGPVDRLLAEGGHVDRLLSQGGALDRVLEPGGVLDQLINEGGLIDRFMAVADTLERVAPKLESLHDPIAGIDESAAKLALAVAPLSQLVGFMPGARVPRMGRKSAAEKIAEKNPE
jgi:hypothetical protein